MSSIGFLGLIISVINAVMSVANNLNSNNNNRNNNNNDNNDNNDNINIANLNSMQMNMNMVMAGRSLTGLVRYYWIIYNGTINPNKCRVRSYRIWSAYIEGPSISLAICSLFLCSTRINIKRPTSRLSIYFFRDPIINVLVITFPAPTYFFYFPFLNWHDPHKNNYSKIYILEAKIFLFISSEQGIC